MSAILSEQRDDGNPNPEGETPPAGTSVVVRRRAGLAALIGAGASAVAIAYLWRASQTMLLTDWALCGVMTVIATLYLATFVDSRTPLLVADHHGARIRLGQEWRGLPWDSISDVVVRPRQGWLRDGRIVLLPRSRARALEGLAGKGRRQARLNQRMYGAALVVPLGITTRVSNSGERTLAQEIDALMQGRAEGVEIVDTATSRDTLDHPRSRDLADTDLPDSPDTRDNPDAGPEVEERVGKPRQSREAMLGGLATFVSQRVTGRGKARRHNLGSVGDGSEAVEAVEAAPLAPATQLVILPLREARRATRAEVTRDIPATMGSRDLAELLAHDPLGKVAEGNDVPRPGTVNLVTGSDRVRPILKIGDGVDPLVIEDFVTEPANNPVIGPELAASRIRLGQTVDGLAERTRIRPHVIESIEVDDFAPCGGDFYARGHIRTLARLLGKDPAPLLQTFEERYATAPVSARRVFEAELASGSVRSTRVGPRWSLLIGVVLALILVWGAVRLISGAPSELVQSPAPVLNGLSGIDRPNPAAEKPAPPVKKPLPVMLVAAFADSRVRVRNGDGRLVFSGQMVLGEKKRLQVVPPVRVWARDGGAIDIVVRRTDMGVLGQFGEPGRRTFRPPSLNGQR